MENQRLKKTFDNEVRVPQKVRGSLRLDELSNLVLRSSSTLINNLIDVKHQLVFTVGHSGELIPAIFESDIALVTKPVHFMKARPALYIEFPQRNEALRRQMFEKPRPIDYLGNDPAKLIAIARSGDLKCKYRMQTLIDETDDQIAMYLGRNLYSTSLDKRPRINLEQLRELWPIIPQKAVHLANVLSFGSSLILHRRSQRLNSMARTQMSRIERLFYFHPLITDGSYPFSFEPEKEADFINFILHEVGTNAILNSQKRAEFLHYWSLFNKTSTVFITITAPPGLTVSESLNNFERRKFPVEKKNIEFQGDLIMPGNTAQKTFLLREWSKIRGWEYTTLKALMTPNRVVTTPEPGSNGFLSKVGRLRVKSNLRTLFKYCKYLEYRLTHEPSCGYWINEHQETLHSIHVNLLLWQTNSIKPFGLI